MRQVSRIIQGIKWIGEVAGGLAVVAGAIGVLAAGLFLGFGVASGWSPLAQTLVIVGLSGIVVGIAAFVLREIRMIYAWFARRFGWHNEAGKEGGVEPDPPSVDVRGQVTELLHMRLGYVLRQTDVSPHRWQLQVEKDGIPFTLTKAVGDDHLMVSLQLNVDSAQAEVLRNAPLALRQELTENLTRDLALVDVEASHTREDYVVNTISINKNVMVGRGVVPVELLDALNGIVRAHHVASSIVNRTVRLASELAPHTGGSPNG